MCHIGTNARGMHVTGKTGWPVSSGPWLIAGLLWVAGIWTSMHAIGPDAHGLIDCAALIATFWAITRHYSGPRLRPGERIVSDEEFFRMEQAMARGLMAGLPVQRTPGSGSTLKTVL
jgi:hypothetical protein